MVSAFLRGVAAHSQYLIQMGNDLLHRARLGDHHAQLPVLRGENMGQPTRPAPLGIGPFVGQHGDTHIMIAVQCRELRQYGLRKLRPRLLTKDTDYGVMAKINGHGGVFQRSVQFRQAGRLIPKRVVDQRQAGRICLDGERDLHIAKAQTDGKKIVLLRTAFPKPCSAALGHLHALLNVGVELQQALSLLHTAFLQLRFHSLDICAVRRYACGLDFARLLFPVIVIQQPPHDREGGRGANHNDPGAHKAAAGTGER